MRLALRFDFLVALLLALTMLACGEDAVSVDPASKRATGQGDLVGSASHEGKVHVWRGIPYAAPPVGARRWRAPASPVAWSGVREALASGSPCTQLGGEPIMGSEDCLYLDIYAPAFVEGEMPSGAERLPVMYWIHGGGNSMGWGDQLDPSRLVAENDVIVVTINYRLGIFGWLSHPALRATAAGPEDASGNFATLDMIRGLEWVRDEIENFGGDPNRVTIFGESAGAIDVYSLLLSPPARGLFNAAIAESGPPVTMTRSQAEHYTDDEDPGLPGSSRELLVALLQQEAGASDRQAAKDALAAMSAGEVESFLRGLSSEVLLQPFVDAVEGSTLPIYITPTVFRDGHVVSALPPLEAFSTPGAYTAVPFISGANREETKLFTAMDSPHVSYLFGLPTGFENERLYDIEGEYGGLLWRAQAVDEPVSRMRAVQGPSVWAYRFDWDEEPTVLGTDLSKLLGAAHALEMLFVFGLTDLGFANRFIYDDVESARVLSRQMRSYWAGFAHTFRPGNGQEGDLPEWMPWGLEQDAPKYMVFDSPRDAGLSMQSDEIDQAFVKRRALQDPRLLDEQERCGILKNLLQWGEALTVGEYSTIAGGICRAFPLGSRLPFASLAHRPEPERPEPEPSAD